MSNRFYLGIDVGTGSVRAGIFDASGVRVGLGVRDIQMWKPQEDFVEQSSEDIWQATGGAVRDALQKAGLAKEAIVGIGFDATCSLVALGENDQPVTVSPRGSDEQNIIVWMDHRAVEQSQRINEGQHKVLKYVGGVISPEMETPKLLWLKEKLPQAYARVVRFLDLADFMTYRATGIDTRSLCTTVCKWTYLGHVGDGQWDEGYFRAIGLGDLAENGFAKIGTRVRPMGERIGGLTAKAAAELGLLEGTAVGVSIIDAHAGALGLLGARIHGESPTAESIEERLALIGGTSTCHLVVSQKPKEVPGVWGPYWSALIPGYWLTEGGQSATGGLIDHVIFGHVRGPEIAESAQSAGMSVYDLINRRLDMIASKERFAAVLTKDLHVLADHHGNRSPRADPTLRGMISGLKLTNEADSLVVLYLATIQAIAYGTRHILEVMNRSGHRIKTLIASGGDAKNTVFVREHADITGCPVVLPKDPEAVLLGAAILGAVACGDQPTILSAMGAMNQEASVVQPAGGEVAAYHEAKYRVYLRMYEDQMAYRSLMGNQPSD